MRPIIALAVLMTVTTLHGQHGASPYGVTNLLVQARVSGNLASFGKGLRGAPDQVIWDTENGQFVTPSSWHEYGVGFNSDLGVVPENAPAWWLAEWDHPIEPDIIALTGTYENQPQPDTAWKIELRLDGSWREHARGVGGWYDRGQYAWDRGDGPPLRFDALRVSVFSRDPTTPIGSIHFRGESGRSWVIARAPGLQTVIEPLKQSVRVGRSTAFAGQILLGAADTWTWDFGDGQVGTGQRVVHTFAEPGIYAVSLTARNGTEKASGLLLVRAHDATTLGLPQIVLDTDQKNEQDDQHYLGYGLFSELDILAVNSVHHGGGQEAINYAEILHVIDLAEQSNLPAGRTPLVYRGADGRLEVPETGNWQDTVPIHTGASDAILAAVRGASPENPVWVVPVGPGTNVASAILLAQRQGLALDDRLRIMWLGGSNEEITNEFNGNNDPWSMFVIAQSGVETWIMPAPVGARVAIDKSTEGHLYGDLPLGNYLRDIVPNHNKPLFDPSCLSAIISQHLDLGWVKRTEFVTVGGPAVAYRWTASDALTTVRIIRDIDHSAMQRDLFESMQGRPTRLIGPARR